MRWLRSAVAAASMASTGSFAFAGPAALLEPPSPNAAQVAPPARDMEPDVGVLKTGRVPSDVSASKPSPVPPLTVPLPKPPVATYPLPAIPLLPKAEQAPGARPKPANTPPAPEFTSPFLPPISQLPPMQPTVKSPAPTAKGPTAVPGKGPAFPTTASSGAATATAPVPVPQSPAALAATPCGAGLCQTVSDPAWHLFPQEGRVRAYGWLNGGYVYNTSNPNSKFNGPYNSVDRSAEPMFNQGYGVLEATRPTGGAWGVGGRVDLLFGYDHFLGQSRGLEIDRDGGRRWNDQCYGLAIPQAYAEVGNDAVALKLGHFYSTEGYESLGAANNFFYSHAYSYQFGQPITQWGGVMTTQLTGNLQVHAGLVNGWDTLVGRENDVNVVGGLKWTPDSGSWWTSFALVSGQNPNNTAGLPAVRNAPANRSRYSFLFGLTPGGPCGPWEYVFHHYYGWQENGTPQGNFARWYGIDQYLYYRVSDKWKVGTRFEWFRDEDGTRVGLNRASNPNNPPLPGNYFSLTGGVNYAPVSNFVVRPEVRWDFTSDTARPAFNDGRKNNQLLLGCDLIWKY